MNIGPIKKVKYRDKRPKTILLDLDGTIFKHERPTDLDIREPQLLDGVMDKILEWDSKAYNIIILTGRKESLRPQTIDQLRKCGVMYDQLIMGVGPGVRVLINDHKPFTEPHAVAVNVERDQGIKEVKV